jgi:hypothetical protein
MSTKRELVWFKRTLPAATNTTASEFKAIASVTANTTNTDFGAVPADAHKSLAGRIERIVVWNGCATATGALDVIFFASGTEGTAISDESYLGHESFVAADFLTHGGTVSVASSDNLAIDYFDATTSKQFHIGLKYDKVTAKEGLTIKWAWRADRGE